MISKTRKAAIVAALEGSEPHVDRDGIHLLSSAEFKAGWAAAVADLSQKISYAVDTADLPLLRRAARTWGRR